MKVLPGNVKHPMDQVPGLNKWRKQVQLQNPSFETGSHVAQVGPELLILLQQRLVPPTVRDHALSKTQL